MSLLLFNKKGSYAQKVLNISPANLIAYWPLNEASGTTITDRSGNGRNGTYTGVDLGQTGIGDGGTAPFFDATNDRGDLYSAGLASAFSGAEGTVSLWLRANSAAVWSDATQRYLCRLQADGSNYLRIFKATTSNRITFEYGAGGTGETYQQTVTGTPATWCHLAATWSKAGDTFTPYFLGTAGTPQTTLGTFAGSLAATTTCIGSAVGNSALSVWHGWLAHVALWTTPLSAADVARLATL